MMWDDVEKKYQTNDFDDLTRLKLNVDAYRLQLKYLYDPASVVSIGKIDPLPHQIEAFVKMMNMLRYHGGIEGRIRMLIADDVGLGKTIMIGLVVKELLLRKKIERALIVCPSGLQIQWKEEMKDKFNEDFEIIHGQIEDNPYLTTNKAIISVDTCRNETKRELIMGTSWDFIIFDEAHKLKPGSLRHEFGLGLSKRTKHMLLATATPHDGKVENFMGIMKLIDNDLEYSSDSVEMQRYLEPIMIRRLKDAIVDFRGKQLFRNRASPYTIQVDYTPEEDEFYTKIEDYVKTYYVIAEKSQKSTAILALYILHRRVSSSIEAGVKSLIKRKARILEPYVNFEADKELDYLDYLDEGDELKKDHAEDVLLGATASTGDELKAELKDLDELIEIGKQLLKNENDSKYKKLMEMIDELHKKQPEDKIIIFTEFKDTLYFLQKKLLANDFLISKITGGMTIEAKKEQSRLFEKRSHILLGTEAAGEGLNLQFANIAINYELPWNPNRLEQRIGRVYRYGQKKDVFIYNFTTAFPIDNAVLEKINEKMENIRLVFGDNAVDVIGSLISEKDMLDIFKVSRTSSAGVDKVDELLNEKIEILEEIDKYMVKKQIDHFDIDRMTKDVSKYITHFDIERFFLTYIIDKHVDYDPKADGTYYFDFPILTVSEPECTKGKDINYGTLRFKGTFSKETRNAQFVAMGHPALETSIFDALSYKPLSLISGNEIGALLTYILRFYNGLGNEIYSEPILILKTEDAMKVLDPLEIWEFKPSANYAIKKDEMARLSDIFNEIQSNPEELIKNEMPTIESFVESKNQHDLEIENRYLLTEYDLKIKTENMKKKEHLAKGQNYLISGIENRIHELRSELNNILSQNKRAKEVRWDLCGPIAAGLILPNKTDPTGKKSANEIAELEELKRKVELAGMDFVMKYEKEHGREPIDVSSETIRGYDIESSSPSEKRYIEVKSFSTTGQIEITSNEWRTASTLMDDYYLYVVQNVFLKPELKIVRDPYVNLSKYVRKKVIEDYRMILDELPDDIEYVT